MVSPRVEKTQTRSHTRTTRPDHVRRHRKRSPGAQLQRLARAPGINQASLGRLRRAVGNTCHSSRRPCITTRGVLGPAIPLRGVAKPASLRLARLAADLSNGITDHPPRTCRGMSGIPSPFQRFLVARPPTIPRLQSRERRRRWFGPRIRTRRRRGCRTRFQGRSGC